MLLINDNNNSSNKSWRLKHHYFVVTVTYLRAGWLRNIAWKGVKSKMHYGKGKLGEGLELKDKRASG